MNKYKTTKAKIISNVPFTNNSMVREVEVEIHPIPQDELPSRASQDEYSKLKNIDQKLDFIAKRLIR